MVSFLLNLITGLDGSNQVEPKIFRKSLILDILQKYGGQKIIVNGDPQTPIGIIVNNKLFLYLS
jgi:hypothetical protein